MPSVSDYASHPLPMPGHCLAQGLPKSATGDSQAVFTSAARSLDALTVAVPRITETPSLLAGRSDMTATRTLQKNLLAGLDCLTSV